MADEAKPAELLAQKIQTSASTGQPVTGALKTNDRIIARVTDGIYREPWSAFRELISNAYDADATHVSIDCDYPFFKEIRITDNGNGMNEQVVGDLLVNIGGSSKRTARGKRLGVANDSDPTKSPGGRNLIGKIGVGLFAVAQLTQQFQIITKRKGETKRVSATIHLDTFRENALVDEETDIDIASGTYSVIAEESPDIDDHGTTIVLTGIRPAIRQKFQSQEIWEAVDESQDTSDSGLLDVVVAPEFNIGRIGDAGDLIQQANLPWNPLDKPRDKFAKLVDAAVDNKRPATDQKNLEHFDNYLKMLWRISVAAPIKYIDGHPFDLSEADGFDVFHISNKKKGAVEAVSTGSQSVRQAFNLVSGESSQLTDFTVVIDSVELRRPIRLPNVLQDPSRLTRPAIFVGKVSTNFGGATTKRSGGNLSFEAYLYWNTRIIPKENIGAIVRVNNASGTLFDPEFLGYQVSEQQRKKQVSCEIFVIEGLDGALNIDRESFNTSNPHYLYLQKWLHSAFRQFATLNKRKGREAKQAEDALRGETERAGALKASTEVWQKMRGGNSPPPLVFRSGDSLQSANANFTVGPLPINVEKRADTRGLSAKSELIDAISIILDAHGVLEYLSDEGRADLIFDLASIIEANK